MVVVQFLSTLLLIASQCCLSPCPYHFVHSNLSQHFCFHLSKHLPFAPFLYSRNRIGFSSTAAERRTTGDDCHNDDDGGDEQSLSVTHVRMLEVKTNKLEEQVRDLTVSHLYLLQELFQKVVSFRILLN